MTRRFADVEALRGAIGESLGSGSWIEIDQERVDAFAAVTDDRQWIHVDTVRAAAGPYQGTVAHGYLTLSLLPALGRSIFTVDGLRMSINYGLDRVRFPHPVRVGARIRAHATLAGVTDTGAGTQAVVSFTVEIDGESKPACIAETVRLLVPSRT
ncbi:MaoC family dehydratase [Kribbella solani]|uniref:Acyl dehydratase n=1 Tax=Kribbella solani TaxID=236067 RepID=A0A841DLG8_9ACTN|nr:MaoC/PaaZ C-terminal domain-containing protein [Kribbella solani]MBB5979944.1 acyl dehydratase [Kribbella solani]MDX3004856.1 MaoC family dehydratase [Kribbella solani]